MEIMVPFRLLMGSWSEIGASSSTIGGMDTQHTMEIHQNHICLMVEYTPQWLQD